MTNQLIIHSVDEQNIYGRTRFFSARQAPEIFPDGNKPWSVFVDKSLPGQAS